MTQGWDMACRFIFVLTGTSMIAGAAYAVVHHMALASLWDPAAVVVFAMAVGMVVGYVAVAEAIRWKRPVLAVILLLCIAAAEVYTILLTAERLIVQRAGPQAVLLDQLARHERAKRQLDAIRGSLPLSAPRGILLAAEKRLEDAEVAARADASKPGCRKECSALHREAAARAEGDVREARLAIGEHDRREATRLASMQRVAELDLGSSPLPPSASPVADMLRISPRALNIIVAALGAAALNVLAGGLIYSGVHGPRHRDKPRSMSEPQLAVVAPVSATVKRIRSSATALAPPVVEQVNTAPITKEDILVQVSRFGLAAMRPGEADSHLGQIRERYLAWCRSQGEVPVSNSQLRDALLELFRRSGVTIVAVAGTPVARGVRLIEQMQEA